MNPTELDSAGIVLVGSLNPAIFHPAWFAAKGLLRDAEADSATVELVSPEFTAFSLEWLRLVVTNDRFSASATAANSNEPLRDLVAGTFTILEHTPVRALGLNRHMHFRMSTREAWNAVGDRLAPKAPWRGLVDDPGMLSVKMQCKRRDCAAAGTLNVKVEPSTRIAPFGVYVEVNEHHERQGATVADLVAIARDRFDESMAFALSLAQQLVEETGT